MALRVCVRAAGHVRREHHVVAWQSSALRERVRLVFEHIQRGAGNARLRPARAISAASSTTDAARHVDQVALRAQRLRARGRRSALRVACAARRDGDQEVDLLPPALHAWA